MFVYLWLLFALFTYHKAIVLAHYNIEFKPFGIAMFNAFVLAKIMLVVEKMNIAAKLRGRPLVYPILHKSFVLAVVFLLFNMAETVIRGLGKGETFADSLPKFGGGSLGEMIVVAIILAVALIPFFSFRELSRALGKGVLGALLMKSSPPGNEGR
jgi:hypothetical protein